jgi:hypothetical protein
MPRASPSRCASRLGTLALATWLALGLAMAPARAQNQPRPPPEPACDAAGRLARGDLGHVDTLSGRSGAARQPIAVFADGEILFVVYERLSTIVVPPALASTYVGTLNTATTTTVLLRRQRGGPLVTAQGPQLRDNGALKVVGVTRSDDFTLVPRGDDIYLVVPGMAGNLAGGCIDARVALLPARNAAVFRLPATARVRQLGDEIAVDGIGPALLVTACCNFETIRPDDIDLDPRQIVDGERFLRYVAAERFRDPRLDTDWTAAARIAHDVFMQGRSREASQVLARLATIPAAAGAPGIALLADLTGLSGGVVEPFPPTPSSVRESRARIGLAREILGACRSGDLDAIAGLRLGFGELLPDLRSLPPDTATRLLICEAQRFALLGDPRAALTRLRAPDRPAGIEDTPLWLAMDLWLLERVGQEELAGFRRSRLRALVGENPAGIDLRGMERFAAPGALLGDDFTVEFLLAQRGSFGDARIDAATLTTALRNLPAARLAPLLGRLGSWRAAAEAPALAARIDRVIGRRMIAADDADLAGSPIDAYQLARLLAAAPHLADLGRALELVAAESAATAGLVGEARRELAEFATRAGGADRPLLPRFARAIDRYVSAQRLLDDSLIAADPIWSIAATDGATRATLAERRAATLAGLVGDAVLADPERSGADMPELRILERLRRLRAAP